MASSKTKRMAAVTTLAAALLLGGVAAAQAHDDDNRTCVGKGQGHGTGAPSENGKGKGQGTGAPSENGKGQGQGTGAPSADRRCKDHEHGGGSDPAPVQDPGPAQEPGDDIDVPGNTPSVHIEVDVNANAELPDLAELAEDTVQDVVGIITPAAVNAVGQTLETADTATDLLKHDVSAIVDVLDSAMAGATSLELGSADAGINVGPDGASGTFNVTGATSGVTSLGGQLLEGVFGIAGGTTGAVTSLVAGMSLPI